VGSCRCDRLTRLSRQLWRLAMRRRWRLLGRCWRPRISPLPFGHGAHSRAVRAKLCGFEPLVVRAAVRRVDVFEPRGSDGGGGLQKKRGQREELPRAAKRQVAGAGADSSSEEDDDDDDEDHSDEE
jgi:hypothetical protein